MKRTSNFKMPKTCKRLLATYTSPVARSLAKASYIKETIAEATNRLRSLKEK